MQLLSAGTKQPPRYCSTLVRRRSTPAVSAADEELNLSGIPSLVSGKNTCLSNILSCLRVLQEISAMIVACQHSDYDNEKLFFSTPGSIHTVSDIILRKVRGLFMVVSSDCIKLELLEGENTKPSLNNSKGKLGGCGVDGFFLL